MTSLAHAFSDSKQARLRDYSVEILPEWGNSEMEIQQGSYYAYMPGNNCKYSIKLRNHCTDTACDASITLDDDHVGTFRIRRGGSIMVERPIYAEKKFTFFEGGTSQANQAGYKAGDSKNGLVKIVFNPEKPQYYGGRLSGLCRHDEDACQESSARAMPTSMNMSKQSCGYTNSLTSNTASYDSNAQEGVTGLSGSSSQSFHNVDALNYDDSKVTTILLRLVTSGKNTQVREPDIVPLGSTPFPGSVSKPCSTPYPQPAKTMSGVYY